MTMNSIIELYLTAYGWQIYGVIYLFFFITKIALIPLIIFGVNLLVEAYSEESESEVILARAGVKLFAMIIVFILAVVPISNFDASTAVIQNVGCGQSEPLQSQKDELNTKFANHVRIPLMVNLLLQMSSGLTSAVFSSMPCASDLLFANQLAHGVNLGEYKDSESLRIELDDFNQQCYSRAKNLARQWNKSSSSVRREVFRALGEKYYEKPILHDSNKLYSHNTERFGSSFFIKIFYSDYAIKDSTPLCTKTLLGGSVCSSVDLSSFESQTIDAIEEAWLDMQRVLPLLILTNQMHGVHPKCNLSPDQEASGIGCVSCAEYWEGDGQDNGLIHRIAKNNMLSTLHYYQGEILQGGSSHIPGIGKFDSEAFNNDPEEYAKEIVSKMSETQLNELAFKAMHENNINPEAESFLGGFGKVAVNAYSIASVFDAISSKGKSMIKDAKTAMSFYLFMQFMKDSLKIIYPMTLMVIYMFWFIFMFIGGYSGKSLYQGLLMLFVLKLIPLGWGIITIASGEIMELLYPGKEGIGWLVDEVESILVMIALNFFYLALPSLMLYFFTLAGASSVAHSINTGIDSINNKFSTGVAGIISKRKR